MKPLKVLVYLGNVVSMKAQGNEPTTFSGNLISTSITEFDNGQWFESGCVVFDNGLISYAPLDRIEVLPGQFDSETVIELDVPGAINNALNPDSL